MPASCQMTRLLPEVTMTARFVFDFRSRSAMCFGVANNDKSSISMRTSAHCRCCFAAFGYALSERPLANLYLSLGISLAAIEFSLRYMFYDHFPSDFWNSLLFRRFVVITFVVIGVGLILTLLELAGTFIARLCTVGSSSACSLGARRLLQRWRLVGRALYVLVMIATLIYLVVKHPQLEI